MAGCQGGAAWVAPRAPLRRTRGFGWPPLRLGSPLIGLRSGTVHTPGGLPSGIFQLPLFPDLAACIAELRFGAPQGPFFSC